MEKNKNTQKNRRRTRTVENNLKQNEREMREMRKFNELTQAQDYYERTGRKYAVTNGRVIYGVTAETERGIKNLDAVIKELICLGADIGIDTDENYSIIFSLCGYNGKEQTKMKTYFMDKYEVDVF